MGRGRGGGGQLKNRPVHSTDLCLKLLLCLYIKAPGLLPDLEGEDDEGEEPSPGEVDEERIEEVVEEGLCF